MPHTPDCDLSTDLGLACTCDPAYGWEHPAWGYGDAEEAELAAQWAPRR
jgi:hypothetical protein